MKRLGVLLSVLLLTATALPCAAATVREPMRVVYGFDREFPPFSFEEPGGKATGFEVELLEAIFRGKVNLVTRPLQWDMVPLELSSGTIHVTSGMVQTEQRSKLYTFSQRPTLPLPIRLFTKTYNRFPNITFLRGQTVAVEQGSYQHRLLQNFGGINIKTYADKVSPLRALFNDEVTAYCGPVQTAYYLINKLNYTSITTMGTPLGITEMRFAVNRDRGDILKMINDGFNELVANGEYDRIYRKWFVRDLSEAETKKLAEEANKALLSAYAPYSGKGFGAAVLTATGNVYSACNVENADTRLSSSAVVNAVSRAIAAGDLEILGVLCVNDQEKLVSPAPDECQFLYEFGRGILAVVPDGAGGQKTVMMSDMLPNPVIGKTKTLSVQ